jgi:hypothetical protein
MLQDYFQRTKDKENERIYWLSFSESLDHMLKEVSITCDNCDRFKDIPNHCMNGMEELYKASDDTI